MKTEFFRKRNSLQNIGAVFFIAGLLGQAFAYPSEMWGSMVIGIGLVILYLGERKAKSLNTPANDSAR